MPTPEPSEPNEPQLPTQSTGDYQGAPDATDVPTDLNLTPYQKAPPDHLFQKIPITATLPQLNPPSSEYRHDIRNREALVTLIDRSRAPNHPRLILDYRLERELGSGAYGSVWEAVNLHSEERVAIKFFLPDSSSAAGNALEEVTVLQAVEGCFGIVMVKQVSKRGIAPYFIPYYVMPLATGGSLQQRLDQGPLPLELALSYFRQIVKALAFVHGRGVLHCDLKPANILINDAGEPVIADFGQAKKSSNATVVLGTFFYMAPEQASRERKLPNARWDVYGLGALLYAMLTGTPPRYDQPLLASLRNRPDIDEVLKTYRERIAEVDQPTAHRKKCDAMTANLIDRCLSLDPDLRPASADEVLRTINHRDWWQRTRPVITVGTVATLIFLLIMVGLSVAIGGSMLRQSRKDLSREIQGSLQREAWFGHQILEHRFQRRIRLLEQASREIPPTLRQELTRLSNTGAEAIVSELREPVRQKFDVWLQVQQQSLVAWEGPNALAQMSRDDGAKNGPVSWQSIGLMVVAPNATTPEKARGYHVGRILSSGQPDRRDGENFATLYQKDYSFRDYFNGTGNDYANPNSPHGVIRTTHISQVYPSNAETKPWLIDIATPIFAPDGSDQIVGLLVSGFHVIDDLQQWLKVKPREKLDSNARDGKSVAEHVRTVLVNDRGNWVWHESGMKRLLQEKDAGNLARDPDRYFSEPPENQSLELQDPIDTEISGHPMTSIALFEPLRPYSQSQYQTIKEKKWYLVVMVGSDRALEPITELKNQVLWAASIVCLTLAILATVLWVWLIRLLRQQEFATHG